MTVERPSGLSSLLNQFVELSCPCDRPLSIRKDEKGHWQIGAVACGRACSPLITCLSLQGAVEKLLGLKKDGNFNAEYILSGGK